MSAKLTTHVLDTVTGRPAAGMKIQLRAWPAGTLLKEARTNSDGRLDEALLAGPELLAGDYELLFGVGDYFGEKRFLDEVPIRFRISDPTASFHVPLLCTPWSYSTYRGS